MRDIFERIYQDNHWKGSTSRSGPGSSKAATESVRGALTFITRAFDVTTVIDAPCGDFHWMAAMADLFPRYIGIDVVPEAIATAQRQAPAHCRFIVGDITSDALPAGDLVLCRDCLVHLTADQVFAALRNICRTDARLLLSTTFYAMDTNLPGATGGWRPLNLQAAPFYLPRPLALFPERSFGTQQHSDKSLGLWRIEELRHSLLDN